jgi:hypothetical protein
LDGFKFDIPHALKPQIVIGQVAPMLESISRKDRSMVLNELKEVA